MCTGKKDNPYVTCDGCRKKHAKYLITYNQINWGKKAVRASRENDKKYKRFAKVADDYITDVFLHGLRTKLGNRCCYCEIMMQTTNRRSHDGLTVERLNNAVGHSLTNCVLCCFSCNSRRFSNDSTKRKYSLKRSTDYLKARKELVKNLTMRAVQQVLVEIIGKVVGRMEPRQRYPRMVY
jgi:hypothetical protein